MSRSSRARFHLFVTWNIHTVYYFTLLSVFFPLESADRFSLVFERERERKRERERERERESRFLKVLKDTSLFSPISTMLQFWCTLLILWSSTLPALFPSFLWADSSASITIGITVTLMFHSFLSSLARSRYLSLFSLSWFFNLHSAGTVKSTKRQVLFFR